MEFQVKNLIPRLFFVLLALFMPMQSLAISNYDRNAAILDTVWYDARDYGTSCALGGNSTPLDGNDNPERIFLYLIGK